MRRWSSVQGVVNVLVVEDSPDDAILVERELRRTGAQLIVTRVESEAAMRETLAAQTIHLVISDWSLPQFSGARALEVAREIIPDVPFIIVSGDVGEEVAVAAMRAGACDYVLKDRLRRLVPAVERELRDAKERVARRAAEEQLRLQDRRFLAMVERATDVITLKGEDDRFLYVSPAIDAMLGFCPDELVGRPCLEVVHPDDRERVEASNRTLRTTVNQPVVRKFRVLHRDGSVRWLEATETNRLADPAVRGIIGNVRDVTARHEAEAALRASENRFARLAETAVIGIAVMGFDGVIQDVNDTMLGLTGYERRELLAPSFRWLDLVPPEHQARSRELVRVLQSQGAIDPFERDLVRKDGTRVWVLLGAAVLDESKVIKFVVDLSAQKRAEAALALSEQQLRHAQKMESMGRLAGGVAHDFNNVLSVILSYAEMVIEDVAPGHVRDDIVEIRKAAERAAELTEQLLVFSRKHAVVSTLVEPAQVVHDLERMLRRLIGEDVALEIAQSDEVPTIRIDKGQLDQVLINLAINARDAMPKGGKLTISLASVRLDHKFAATHHGVAPGRYARIVVTDTGTGIDPATLARIFEPFFTTKDVGKGTGLGLSTVFGIIQRAGGTIWVTSELGVGTSFTMYLPHSEDASMPISTLPLPSDLRGTETILIAEDDPQVRMVAEHILRRAGYQVLSARSGVDAIRIANEHHGPIDLLISDVVMPQLSGVELAHRISLSRPGIAVLHISGYTDDVVELHGALSEAQFLQKPLTPESLRAKVRQALATRGIARSA